MRLQRICFLALTVCLMSTVAAQPLGSRLPVPVGDLVVLVARETAGVEFDRVFPNGMRQDWLSSFPRGSTLIITDIEGRASGFLNPDVQLVYFQLRLRRPGQLGVVVFDVELTGRAFVASGSRRANFQERLSTGIPWRREAELVYTLAQGGAIPGGPTLEYLTLRGYLVRDNSLNR